MSASVTETDDFSESVVTPVLGDKFTYPTTVPLALTALASRTRHLLNTLNGSGPVPAWENLSETDDLFTPVSEDAYWQLPVAGRANEVRLALRTIVGKIQFLRNLVFDTAWGSDSDTRFMPVPVEPVAESNGDAIFGVPGTIWTVSATASLLAWKQDAIYTSPVTSPCLWWYVKGLPPKGMINLLAVRVRGGSGHSILPANKPSISLFSWVAGSSPALVGTFADASVNAVAYEAEHTIYGTDLTVTLQPNCAYFLKFTGESGSGALPGLQVFSSYIGITRAV